MGHRFKSALALALLAAACAHPRTGIVIEPGSTVYGDPRPAVPKADLERLGERELFEAGVEAQLRGGYRSALDHFFQLLNRHPESGFVLDALQNAGLASQALGQEEQSARLLCRAADLHPSGHPRRAGAWLLCFEACERAGQDEAVLTRDRSWPSDLPLGPSGMVERESMAGQALFRLGLIGEARPRLERAADLYRLKGEPYLLRGDGHAARAAFLLGEIGRAAFETETVAGDGDREVLAALERKAAGLLAAQDRYVQAIATGVAAWAVPAGYRIGSMYEMLFRAFIDAPAPPGQSGEERTAYRCLIGDRVRPLVAKALRAYDQTLAAARRSGTAGPWTGQVAAALDELQAWLAIRERGCEGYYLPP